VIATSPPKEEVLEEWKAAQDILKQFDEYHHDIRKYGFSFVTALLTVDALLGSVEEKFKLAALTGTMALIVVLYVIDRNYKVFLVAANLRATLLERRSSPELAQTITRLYESGRVGLAFSLVYAGLVSATALLGLLVVSHLRLLEFLGAAYFVSLLSMELIRRWVNPRPFVYFDIDGFTYKKKTPILAVVTNFDPRKQGSRRSITLANRKEAWAIYRESDAEMAHPICHSRLEKKDIQIAPNSDYRWQINTGVKGLRAGLYRIVYKGPIFVNRGSGKSLTRFINNYEYLEHSEREKEEDAEKAWANAPRFRITD